MLDAEAITFGCAGAGYILLAKDSALRLTGRRWPMLGALTALVVITHIVLIWAYRYDWSLERATQNVAAFLIFHAAAASIAVTPALQGRTRDRVTWLSFLIVSSGALPAVFRYEEVAILAVPLWLAFAAVVVIGATRRNHRRGATDA